MILWKKILINYKFSIDSQVNFFETSIQIFNHIDLLTREVFMPLLCADNASNNDQADKLMDLMHRMISQISLTQSQIEVIYLLNNFSISLIH